MIDTITTVVDTLYSSKSDLLDILTKVDEFYNKSWNKLMWFLGSFSVLLGAFVTWIYIIDRKDFKDINEDVRELKKKIKELEAFKEKNEGILNEQHRANNSWLQAARNSINQSTGKNLDID